MKTTVVIDFELGLAWTLVEAEYRFDFDATQDAIAILRDARLSVAGVSESGWTKLYHAGNHLEAQVTAYVSGK